MAALHPAIPVLTDGVRTAGLLPAESPRLREAMGSEQDHTDLMKEPRNPPSGPLHLLKGASGILG